MIAFVQPVPALKYHAVLSGAVSTFSVPFVSTKRSAFPGAGVDWPNASPLAVWKNAWIDPNRRPESCVESPVATMKVMTSPPLSVSVWEISSLPFPLVPAQYIDRNMSPASSETVGSKYALTVP